VSLRSKNSRTVPLPSEIHGFWWVPAASALISLSPPCSLRNRLMPLLAKLCSVASSIAPSAELTRRTSMNGTRYHGMFATVLAASACQTLSASW
jgi:hypothetical protein